jgi:hypothetical protein
MLKCVESGNSVNTKAQKCAIVARDCRAATFLLLHTIIKGKCKFQKEIIQIIKTFYGEYFKRRIASVVLLSEFLATDPEVRV